MPAKPPKPNRVPPLDARKVAQLLAAAQRRPELPDFSWSDDPATFDGSSLTVRKPAPAITPAAKHLPLCESDPRTYDDKRRKIRDRYIGIRFAGIIRSAGDLDDAPRIIRAARAAFEEDHPETALEVFELAIEQNVKDKTLWLADLEITFLIRNAERFVASARAFRLTFPDAAEWKEIQRLGRALAPGETLFGARQGARAHEHYGPWPDLPNWILAPWDLTPEVAAADFHRAMTSEAPDA
jgi:hypothetical protein